MVSVIVARDSIPVDFFRPFYLHARHSLVEQKFPISIEARNRFSIVSSDYKLRISCLSNPRIGNQSVLGDCTMFSTICNFNETGVDEIIYKKRGGSIYRLQVERRGQVRLERFANNKNRVLFGRRQTPNDLFREFMPGQNCLCTPVGSNLQVNRLGRFVTRPPSLDLFRPTV